MTTYRNIHGRSIQAVTTDPTGDITEGQIWYNTTSDTFKTVLLNEAWASASSLATARRSLGAAGNDRDASMAFGGSTGSPATTSNKTEEYNGSGWSSGGNLNTARYILDGAGTQTSGVAFGGATTPPFANSASTEEYDGSSWTASNNLNTARYNLTGLGTQTAALAFGRDNPSDKGNTEEYNGTSWTAANPMNTGRYSAAGSGTQTAALGSGGYSTTFSNAVESYDGTNWTAVPVNLGTARYTVEGSKGGTTSSALVFGGGVPPGSTKEDATEFYDGSTWTTKPNMATAVGQHGGVGTAAAAMSFGGQTPGSPTGTSATEEFTSSANVITAAAWATIANFPDSRAYSGGSGGTPTSTLVFGGYTGPGLGGFVSSGAEFDGSSWTATGDYVIDVVGVAGLGPVTAGLGCGGYKDNATNVTTSAEYDGSSWTSGNSANVAGQGAKMAGIQTAASMGNRSGDTDGHEQYDGTNWTAAANTPDAKGAGSMMAGTQTALLMYGGEASGERNKTEEWNGSSWTSGSNMNLDRRQGSHGGTQTYAIAGGGDSNPGIFGNTELWDGTSWVSSVSMGTARFYQVGGNSVGPSGVTSNIAATGRTPGSTHSNNCEEFSSETIALNVKTLTQS